MARVGIIDYGMGNLVSVAGAVEYLGHTPKITYDRGELNRTDLLILPGVGAFPDAMRNLRQRGLVEALEGLVRQRGTPLLGICLGAQLLARESEEFGRHPGLGWIDATVSRLRPADAAIRVPHVGWNGIAKRREGTLLKGIPDDALFYYVHSYCIADAPEQAVLGDCDYGNRFAAVLESGNVFATQFHPEKSQQHGLAMLRNFLAVH